MRGGQHTPQVVVHLHLPLVVEDGVDVAAVLEARRARRALAPRTRHLTRSRGLRRDLLAIKHHIVWPSRARTTPPPPLA